MSKPLAHSFPSPPLPWHTASLAHPCHGPLLPWPVPALACTCHDPRLPDFLHVLGRKKLSSLETRPHLGLHTTDEWPHQALDSMLSNDLGTVSRSLILHRVHSHIQPICYSDSIREFHKKGKSQCLKPSPRPHDEGLA